MSFERMALHFSLNPSFRVAILSITDKIFRYNPESEDNIENE